MKFFTIDLETTGLEPGVHGVIEIACIVADLQNSFQPRLFHRYIYPEGMVWSAYCLNLHKKIIERLLYRYENGMFAPILDEPKMCRDYVELRRDFYDWLESKDGGNHEIMVKGRANRFTAAGKNFGSFDGPFLKSIGVAQNLIRHRSLDPTLLYTLGEDEVPPELATCKARALTMGLMVKPEVTHKANDDAWDVVNLLQFAFRKGNLDVGRAT